MKISNTILLVEDSRDDAFIFKYTLKKACVTNPLDVLTNGQAAVDYLSANQQEVDDGAACALPFLMFLDIKMPYLDGFEVLAWMRTQPPLQAIVVVILSSSNESRDRQRADELGADGYMVKPPRAQDIRQLVDSLSTS